jgi:hypothetical protein
MTKRGEQSAPLKRRSNEPLALLPWEKSAQQAAFPWERSVRAVAIVLAIVLMVPGVEAIARFTHSADAQSASASELEAASLIDAFDTTASLERIEQAASIEGRALPPAFANEIGLLPSARDVRMNEDGSVIGYVVDCNADKARSQLLERMGSNGWTAVELDQAYGTTFVKTSGDLTWALATCTQVGSSTSVVIRCVIS